MPLQDVVTPPLRMDPVFVFGYARSGTTLLRLMLNAHPSIAIPPEQDYLSRFFAAKGLGDRLYRADEAAALAERIVGLVPREDWGVDAGLLDQLLRRVLPAGAPRVLACLYQAWGVQQGKAQARWGDKKPLHMEFFDHLLKWYPAAQFVHIVRDPRDVTASMMEHFVEHVRLRRLIPPHLFLAWHWCKVVSCCRRIGRQVGSGRYLELRYEDLVTEPASHLKRIAAFLNVEYTVQMLEYQRDLVRPGMLGFQGTQNGPCPPHREILRAPHETRIGRFRTTLDGRCVADIEDICGNVMDALDYPRSRSRTNRFRKATHRPLRLLLSTGELMRRTARRLRGQL